MHSKRCTLRIDTDLLDRLQSIAGRTGMSQSEQIREGIRCWLESRGWPLKSADSSLPAASGVQPSRKIRKHPRQRR